MDLELPGIDGVEATKRLVGGERPLPVVVLSAHVSPGSERAAAALAAGAVEAILKGEVRLTDAAGAEARAVRHRLRRLARARVRPGRPATPPAAPRRTPRSPATAARVRAIGIAASTGGPQALAKLLIALPASFPVPILVVQHMAVGFTPGLASWLDRQTALPVRLGTPGTIAGPGAWFAPDEAHMTVGPKLVLGEDRRTTGRHRPSADVLFASMANALGSAAAGVVLTGLGRDGAQGVAAIVGAGGFVIAQDEESSVVHGMPAAAADAGAQCVLPMDDIAAALQSLRRVPA
jgi:two-component system chemotaxis response regulator CheB